MIEENITKIILKKLRILGFDIIEFDYPQSGTGILLHPCDKNFKSVNPDIVAKKKNKVLIFENKNRYYPKDFEKIHNFKKYKSEYSDSFKKKFGINLMDINLITVIGMPESYYNKINISKRKLVDKIWEV